MWYCQRALKGRKSLWKVWKPPFYSSPGIHRIDVFKLQQNKPYNHQMEIMLLEVRAAQGPSLNLKQPRDRHYELSEVMLWASSWPCKACRTSLFTVSSQRTHRVMCASVILRVLLSVPSLTFTPLLSRCMTSLPSSASPTHFSWP